MDWGKGSVLKAIVLTTRTWISDFPEEDVECGDHAVNLALGRWRLLEPWGSQASQPGLLGCFWASEKSCVKTKVYGIEE